MQELRRHMLDADINTLTFRSMEQLFDGRSVPAGTTEWKLPRADAKLSFTYEYDGKTKPAEAVLESTFTNALLIIKRGQIVTEIYRNNSSDTSRFISFSMAKSIISILIGMALADGHIVSVNDPITDYVPELGGTAYDGVTIRHALMMRSGVGYEERYDFDKPGLAAAMFEESIVRNRLSFVAPALIVKRAHAPGERFNYSTVETDVLGWVLERATRTMLSAYMTERLWKPLGAEASGFWIVLGPLGDQREFSGAGFNATLRDYGRIGLMMLNNGKANGKQIVPANWVAQSTRAETEPVSAGSPFGYQYQWWTLADSDAYMAQGLQGQFIYIDPPTQTVIVKLSHFPPGNQAAGHESIAFFRAVSKWDPSANQS